MSFFEKLRFEELAATLAAIENLFRGSPLGLLATRGIYNCGIEIPIRYHKSRRNWRTGVWLVVMIATGPGNDFFALATSPTQIALRARNAGIAAF